MNITKIQKENDELLVLLRSFAAEGGMCDNDGRGCPCVDAAVAFLENKKKQEELDEIDTERPASRVLIQDGLTGLQFWKTSWFNKRGELCESVELASEVGIVKDSNGLQSLIAFPAKTTGKQPSGSTAG